MDDHSVPQTRPLELVAVVQTLCVLSRVRLFSGTDYCLLVVFIS